MIERRNPARPDDVVGTVAVDDAEAVGRTVGRCADGQGGWAARGVEERSAALLDAARRLECDVEPLARLLARESGKPVRDCRGELSFSVALLRWTASRGPELLADREVDDDQGRLLLRRRPFGVVAAVTPWNAPVVLAMLKVAPALTAGNAVVVKPSPLAPFAVAGALDAVASALPEVVLAVVQGGADTGSALVGDPRVRKVAFTGGDVTGRAIGRLAGERLIPTVMELGGNDPAVLLDDVDLTDQSLERLVLASFATAGQVCMAAKRLYVHRSRLDEVVDGYRAAAERVLLTGDPLEETVTMGPVVTEQAADRVLGLVDDARRRGADVLRLGRTHGDLGRGWFVEPILALGLADDAPLVVQEQFGPALPLLVFDDDDEVVARANASELGLAASVWSADEDRAFALGRRLEAGTVFIGTHNRTGLSLRAPFGGVKGSGFGREYGDEGLLEHVQTVVLHAPAAFRPGGQGMDAGAYPVPAEAVDPTECSV